MPASSLSFAAPYRRSRRAVPGWSPLPIPAAPATPNTPSPANAAQTLYTLLTWLAAGQARADVYLDTVTPPVKLAVPKFVGFAYVPTLLPSTTYYWQIVAFNDGGSAAGPIWSFTTPGATSVFVNLAGTLIPIRSGSCTIHDALGAAPNTGAVLIDAAVPSIGQTLQIGLGGLDAAKLIFGGAVQGVAQVYEDLQTNLAWQLTLIDNTFALNKRRPFGTWTNVSATTIGQYLVAVFAPPGVTSLNIQAGLPLVSIVLDGQQDFGSCMTALAAACGGHYSGPDYANDVHLFLTESTNGPDPIDNAHPPLHDPTPIVFRNQLANVRTRVYGKGHAETVPCDVAAGDPIVPVTNGVMFGTVTPGGLAIAGTIAGGAQSLRFPYTGVQLGAGGSLVGPGAAPSAAPAGVVAVGAGVEAGLHGYAFTDVTAAGESLPSPLATVTVGFLTNPVNAPAVSATAGLGIDNGVHGYAYTDVTAVGETLPTSLTSVTHAPGQAAPNAIGTAVVNPFGTGPLAVNTTFAYAYTFKRNSDSVETTISPTTSFNSSPRGQNGSLPLSGCQSAPAGWTRVWYRTKAGDSNFYLIPGAHFSETSSPGNFIEDASDAQLGALAPTTNGTAVNQSAVSAIAPGPTGTTSRNVYRTVAGGSQLKLLTTLADNTTTTYTDSTADASLGASAPASNTATANQVALTLIAVGVSPTTSRKMYRTAAGASQLKLLTTIADNTTTTYTDSTADASLGANAPTSDASNLTQPSGQVNAGSTSLLVANPGPFQSTGGWALLGSQAIRYTGISSNTLTGIPASGIGSLGITVTYGSQIIASPALTGVNNNNGLTLPMAKGSTVAIWVQRDDLAAQTALGLLERDKNGNSTDGIREYTIPDGRYGEAALIALCDADLALTSRPIVSVDYCTRDPKTKSGKTVTINLTTGMFDPAVFDPAVFDDVATWGLAQDFIIQDVAISEVDTAPNTYPLCVVAASSTRFSLDDLVRKLVLLP